MTTTLGIDKKIEKTFQLIAKIIQEFRELAEVQKELFEGISQVSPFPREHNFSTYNDREEKAYLDSFWGTD